MAKIHKFGKLATDMKILQQAAPEYLPQMWPGQVHGVICVHRGEQLHDWLDVPCLHRVFTGIHDNTDELAEVYLTQVSALN